MSVSALRQDVHLGQRDTKDPKLSATVTLILIEDRQQEPSCMLQGSSRAL